jgi:hypothetical protein
MNRTEDAKFLEMVVPGNDMRAFVCETRKDLQLFLSEVKYTDDTPTRRFDFVSLIKRNLLQGNSLKQEAFFRFVTSNL